MLKEKRQVNLTLLPKIPDDEWVKIIEQWPRGPRRQSLSESEETEPKDDDSSLNQPQEKGDQEKESSELFGTQQLERVDSVVSHQESIDEPQEVCLEASESTQQPPVESGFTVQFGRESSVTPPEVIGYSAAAAAATMVVPGRYPGSLGGFCLNLTPKGLAMTLEEIKAKELLCDPSSYPKELESVNDKLNDYCKLRHERKGLTKTNNWEINFRKEVTQSVTQVNTARVTKKFKSKRNGR